MSRPTLVGVGLVAALGLVLTVAGEREIASPERPAARVAPVGEDRAAIVAVAGDVNGDGFEDVVVGNPDRAGGRAFLYRGSPSGLASTPSWVM